MKLKRFLAAFSFLIVIYAGSACMREIIDPYQVKQISEAFRVYSAFDSLSYWVYVKQGANINNIDTVRVVRVIKDRRFHIDDTYPKGYFYDAIEMQLTSQLTGMIKYELSVGAPHNGSTNNENLRLYFINGRYYRILIPKYPNDELQLLGPEEGNYKNIGMIGSMTINNKIYTDIYHTRVVDYKDAPDTTIWNFYLAKNYGLIKYTRVQSTKQVNDIWELHNSDLKAYIK